MEIYFTQLSSFIFSFLVLFFISHTYWFLQCVRGCCIDTLYTTWHEQKKTPSIFLTFIFVSLYILWTSISSPRFHLIHLRKEKLLFKKKENNVIIIKIYSLKHSFLLLHFDIVIVMITFIILFFILSSVFTEYLPHTLN